MKEVYKINKFAQPEVKSYKDVQKYDVARFEYGDYDNWVDAIILDIKPQEYDSYGKKRVTPVLEIHFAYVWGMEETCYSFDSKLDIIGKAEKLEQEKSETEQEAKKEETSSMSM